MAAVQLDESQKTMKAQIEAHLGSARRHFTEHKHADGRAELLAAADVAHKLHMALKASGHQPQHHSYMLENRRVPPDDPEFYRHIHPIEDLLAFLRDTDANADPEDQTIGGEFELRVYSLRWGHDDVYQVRRTERGWWIGHLSINGDCDKAGDPALFANLRQDSIAHPSDLGYWMEHLWDRAHEEGLSHEQVQDALNQLGVWISTVEKAKPGRGAWAGYARADLG